MISYQRPPLQSVDIVPPRLLQRIIIAAPDTELLLSAKLSFHNFVGAGELSRITRESFIFDRNGQLIQLFVPSSRSMVHRGRYIRISERDSDTLKALTLSPGPLFTDREPWGRLRGFARTLHLYLERNCARRSCITYAIAAGCCRDEVAAKAGINLQSYRHLYCPFSPVDAEAYFNAEFDLARIAALPRHCSQLPLVGTFQ
jgi:hypothetical protein